MSVGDRVRQGSMQPTYYDIALSDGHRFSAIGKFPTRANRAPAESIINEWMACQAAHFAGIQVPPCYIVEASPHVMLHLVERHGITAVSPYGFASRVCPIDAIVYPHTLQAMPLEDVTRLFCFDMLFVNADRTVNNPNCGHSKRRLFAYDFGSALIAPETPPGHFDRFFFGSGLYDRASAHLCRESVTSPKMAEAVLSEIIEKVCKTGWFSGLHLNYLPKPLQDHLKLVSQYLEFIAKERNMVCHQIVSTI